MPAKAGIPAGERHLRVSPPGAPAFAGATRKTGSSRGRGAFTGLQHSRSRSWSVATQLRTSAPNEEPPRHWANQLPYRAIVYVRTNGPTHLFAVAGVKGGPWNAQKALRVARDTYPADCFYCGKSKKKAKLTIDHVEPLTKQGTGDLANLILACKPCNLEKADNPIEVFRPDAGREWLASVLRQVQERLNRLP